MSTIGPHGARERTIIGPVIGLLLGGLGGWILPAPEGASPDLGRTLDIAGPTLSGDSFNLQDLRGKVVLVDFWATWCQPCVAELPNVQKVYDRHHADGFEVVGVSLDKSKDALARFVRQHEVPWPQVFFDGEDSAGSGNPLARRYGVDAIPATFLVDRDGKVTHTNLRGTELERAVAGLLGKEPTPEAGEGSVSRFVHHHLVQLWWAAMGCVVGFVLGGMTERLLRQHAARSAESPADGGPQK